MTELAELAVQARMELRVVLLQRQPPGLLGAMQHGEQRLAWLEKQAESWGALPPNRTLTPRGPALDTYARGLAYSARLLAEQLRATALAPSAIACVSYEGLLADSGAEATAIDRLLADVGTHIASAATQTFQRPVHDDTTVRQPDEAAASELERATAELDRLCAVAKHAPPRAKRVAQAPGGRTCPRWGGGRTGACAQASSRGVERAQRLSHCLIARSEAALPEHERERFRGWAAPARWAMGDGVRLQLIPKAASASLRQAMADAYQVRSSNGSSWTFGGGMDEDDFPRRLSPAQVALFGFSFVAPPERRLVSGLRQLMGSISSASACSESGAAEVLRSLTEPGSRDQNVHLAPQMWLLQNAADDLFRATGAMGSPLKFLGHATREAESDWRDLLAAMTAAGVTTLPASQMPRLHETSQECPLRQLGRFAKLGTFPAEMQERVCDLLRDDFYCLGFTIPPECWPNARTSPEARLRAWLGFRPSDVLLRVMSLSDPDTVWRRQRQRGTARSEPCASDHRKQHTGGATLLQDLRSRCRRGLAVIDGALPIRDGLGHTLLRRVHIAMHAHALNCPVLVPDEKSTARSPCVGVYFDPAAVGANVYCHQMHGFRVAQSLTGRRDCSDFW